MSLFNQNKTPDDSRLKEWGDAERNAPPVRRGRFAGIVDRLTRPVPDGAPKPLFRPAFALAGASVIALSVGISVLSERPGASSFTSKERAEKAVPQAIFYGDAAHKETAQGWRGDLTPYGDGLAARCEPVFIAGNTFAPTIGQRGGAVVPLALTVQNAGTAFRAEVVVEVGSPSVTNRTYTYPVTIPGNGAVWHTTLYPQMANYYAGTCDVSLRTPTHTIALDSAVASTGNVSDQRSVAILDNRIGVLSPRNRKYRDSEQGRNAGVRTIYGKPENAPDRSIGYDAIDTLVLGYGSETLSPAQWAAIREWVKGGGNLVLFGGTEAMRRVLNTPEALALSPATAFVDKARTATPRLKVSNFDLRPLQNGYFDYDRDITLLFPQTMTTAPRLKDDAKIIFRSPMRGATEWATVGARRNLGVGSVAFYGFDPTVPAFRDQAASLTKWWGDVASLDKGALPLSRYRYENAAFGGFDNGSPAGKSVGGVRDPFYTTFPDLRFVLYGFLGYFVLVVPVSFVVLKQTRRMHYAWFTGPALATVFAGGLAISTRNLYTAPQSVRTSGMIALDAESGTGRFDGTSELYVPRAGRFTLDLPGTHPVFGTDYDNPYDEKSSPIVTHTTDTGTGETAPVVDIPNLSFRRIGHSQTVTLGSGITATLHATPSGRLEGTLTNGTGQTLHGVKITMRGDKTVSLSGATYIPVWQFDAKQFAPGSQNIVLTPRMRYKNDRTSDIVQLFDGTVQTLAPRTPFLTARISGEGFAPKRFGRWVGGDNSVRVVAKLPAVPQTDMPRYETTPTDKTLLWDAISGHSEPKYRMFTYPVQGGAK